MTHDPNAKLYPGPPTGPLGMLWPVSIQFGHPNLAASLTDHQLNWGGVAALDALLPFVPSRPGYVAWVSGGLSENVAGSALIIEVYKNGSELVESIVIAIGADAGFANYPVGKYRFKANDRLDLRVTTGSGWTSTTADLGAVLGVVYDPIP